jgi:thiamine biosynthesis lipoprotein
LAFPERMRVGPRAEGLRFVSWQERASFLSFVVLVAFLSFVPCRGEAAPLERYEFRQAHMGTQFKIILYAPEAELASQGAAAAFDRVEQLEEILSDYRVDNELARVNLSAFQTPQVVSPELLGVTLKALELSRKTSGSFDITVKPLVRLWRRAREDGKLPTQKELQLAVERVGYRDVLVNERTRSIRFRKTGMELDFGGIGKGFAADEVLKVLADFGLTQVLVDAGGDIRVGQAPPDRDGWTISVDPAGGTALELSLVNQAVATSGEKYQFVEIDGERYSHVLDPKTGVGLRHSGTVTVLARDATLADALATALSVLSPEDGLKIVQAMDGVEARIVRRLSGIVKIYASAAFPP